MKIKLIIVITSILALMHTGFAKSLLSIQQLKTPAAVTNIEYSSDQGLFIITQTGELWQSKNQQDWHKLSSDISVNSLIGLGQNKISFINKQNYFQLIDHGKLLSSTIEISPKSGFVNLGFAVIAVVKKGKNAYISRIEATPSLKVVAQRQDFTVLPDLRPLAINIAGKGNHIVVLSQPTTEYPHGVLGDDIEAKQLRYLERHDLSDLAQPYQVADNEVIEDNQPINVQQQVAVSLSDKKFGASAGLIGIKANRLTLVARSDAIGNSYRWLSLFSDDNNLYSIVTPHLSGVLTEYQIKDNYLQQHQLDYGVSNHSIGDYQRNSAIIHNQLIFVPTVNKRSIKIWDIQQKKFIAQSKTVPSRIIKILPSVKNNILLLLENGDLYTIEGKD